MRDFFMIPPAIIQEQQKPAKNWRQIVEEKNLDVVVVNSSEAIERFDAEYMVRKEKIIKSYKKFLGQNPKKIFYKLFKF